MLAIPIIHILHHKDQNATIILHECNQNQIINLIK